MADDSTLSKSDRERQWLHLEAVRAFNDQVAAETRLQTFLMPLWDGLSLMRLLD